MGRYPWLLHPGASPAVALASEALRAAAGVWAPLSPHTPSLAPGPLLRFQHHADPLPRAFICAVLEARDRTLWPTATASGRSPGRSSHQVTLRARAPGPSCGHGAPGVFDDPQSGSTSPRAGGRASAAEHLVRCWLWGLQSASGFTCLSPPQDSRIRAVRGHVHATLGPTYGPLSRAPQS